MACLIHTHESKLPMMPWSLKGKKDFQFTEHLIDHVGFGRMPNLSVYFNEYYEHES